MADAELVIGYRLRLILASNGTTIQAFDQDAWAETFNYSWRDPKTSLETFRTLRENNLRLVVKGAGHSYLGTSNAPDSLLIWTRAMNDIVLHDAFMAQGCAGRQSAQPAVSVGAGAIWMHTYNEIGRAHV